MNYSSAGLTNSDLAQRLSAHRLATARRVRDHLRDQTNDLADTPLHIDPAIYFDPERYAAERQKVFRETPVVACLSGDIPEPGDYRTFDEAGVPILVTRGSDREVRAFLNVCPHRGARLVRETKGNAKRFTCWFHGWTFLNSGKMLAATQAGHFGDLSECNHLTAVPAAERHGFVFVTTTAGASMDIDAYLGEFAQNLEFLEIEDFVPVKSVLMEAKANWKYILDTFNEPYHTATLHRDTLAPNYRNDVQIYDSYGSHHRHLTVARELGRLLETQPEADWDLDHRLDGLTYIFPNTLVAAAPRPAKSTEQQGFFYVVFRIFPGETLGDTGIYLTMYGERGQETNPTFMAQVEANCAANVALLSGEDFRVAEEAYPGLKALPKGQNLVLGRQEVGVQRLELAIAEVAGMPLVRSEAILHAAG